MSDGPVYGDMLAAFPELFRDFVVFNMRARAGGGFDARINERLVTGVFRKTPGGNMGVMGDNRERNSLASFYVYEDEVKKITQGTYLEESGDLYLLKKDNNYVSEGGYIKFTAAIVPGATDKQVKDPTVADRALNGFQ